MRGRTSRVVWLSDSHRLRMKGPREIQLPNPMGAHTWFIIVAVGAFLAWCISYVLQLQKEEAEQPAPARIAASTEGRVAGSARGTGDRRRKPARFPLSATKKNSRKRKGGSRKLLDASRANRTRRRAEMPETLALDSKGIEKKFGYAFAVRNVSLQVRRGEFVALFGSNGAGKTTS